MIRILLIGRTADTWASTLQRHTGMVEWDVARLPAAGVRQLEQTPPDAVVVFEDSPQRLVALVDAIKNRPLGALTPVVVVGSDSLADAEREALDVAQWLKSDIRDPALLQALGRVLETELVLDKSTEDFPRPEIESEGRSPRVPTLGRGGSGASGGSGGSAPKRSNSPDFVIEEIDQAPRRLTPQDIFPKRFGAPPADDLDEAELRRKLRSVRHEDYFAILEVPRGAETPVIRDAFHKLVDRFDNQRISFDLQHRYHVEISEIRDAFEDAWAVLGDPKLRADYLDHTTRR